MIALALKIGPVVLAWTVVALAVFIVWALVGLAVGTLIVGPILKRCSAAYPPIDEAA